MSVIMCISAINGTHIIRRLLRTQPLDFPILLLQHLRRLLRVLLRRLSYILKSLEIRLRALVLCTRSEEFELGLVELAESLGIC